jgi:hypothetical protein
MNNLSFTEQLETLLNSSAPWPGSNSLSDHLFLFLILTIAFHAMIILALRLRGLSRATEKACTRDLLLAAVSAMTVILVPVAVYLLGRAIYRAVLAPGQTAATTE